MSPAGQHRSPHVLVVTPCRDQALRDDGAGTVLVLVLALVLVVLAAVVATVGAVSVARHRAAVAADLSALAAARRATAGPGVACASAAAVADAQRARLLHCAVQGLEAEVRVGVPVRLLVGIAAGGDQEARAAPRVTARARAGPAGSWPEAARGRGGG